MKATSAEYDAIYLATVKDQATLDALAELKCEGAQGLFHCQANAG